MSKKKKKKVIAPLLGMAEKEHLYQEIRDACTVVGNCWIYAGETDKSGYGRKRVAGVSYTVSRVMLALATGESFTLAGYEACHVPQCPHRRCCNPGHLHWGTKDENSREREQAQRVLHTEAREYLEKISVCNRVGSEFCYHDSLKPYMEQAQIVDY